MKKLISLAFHRRGLMIVVFCFIAAIGYYSWKQLAIDAYPDIADVTVQVITQVPGLAAEEIEQQITIPIERSLNGLPGTTVMRSRSSFGISTIILVFQDGVDDYWARQRVQERLTDVELPYSATPSLNPLTSPIGEIYRYVLESKNHDLRELTDINKWVVIPRLKQVIGVADVSNFGGITTQYQIEIDPHKMEQYDVTLSDIKDKIEKNNVNAGGSILQQGDLSYVIRGIGLVKNLDDIGKIVVSSKDGVPIYINDIGTLKYGNLERKGVLGFSSDSTNTSDGVEGIVQMLRFQNPSKVLDGIHQSVEGLNHGGLPKGVSIHPFVDRTNLVSTTLHTVSHTLLEGMMLVLLVLFIFLGNWRGAAVVALTIPLSLLIAFILMHLTGIPANLLSLGAIDFGILVDGSIVMMETILKKRESHPLAPLEEESTLKRTLEVARPILFSTLIIITAYLPLFTFEHIEKKLFTPMAYTVGYALIGAMCVSFLLTPALSYIIYRKPTKMRQNKWLEKLSNGYHKQTIKILQHPKKVLRPLIVILILAIGLSWMVGKDFLPPLDEGSIWVQMQLPPGISQEKSKQMAADFRKVIKGFDEVSYVMTQVGRDDEGTDAFSLSHVECCIGLKPYNTWKSGLTKAQLIEKMSDTLSKMPGYTVGFSQPILDMVMDQIAGAHSDLAVKIYGDDLKEIRNVGEQIVNTLNRIKGAADVTIDEEPPLPQLQIIADRDKIALYGLNISDVADVIEMAIGGTPISEIFVGSKSYDVTCKLNQESRDTPEKIGNLMLTTNSGVKIPLSQVATIKLTTGASCISREMNKRHLTVRVNLRGNDLTSFLKEANHQINKNVHFNKQNIQLRWGGQFENQQRAYAKLGVVIPLTLGIMLLLLFAAFGKFRQAILQMCIIPLALFGGMLALNLRGMTLNVSSAVGFIALIGVAIQNGVIMVSHINNLRKKGKSLYDAVTEGSTHRFRPIIMTATVAILGLFPASVTTGIGSDVQRPLATVIVYGLLFSTVITLYILPALYFMVEKKHEDKEQKKINWKLQTMKTFSNKRLLLTIISIALWSLVYSQTTIKPITYSTYLQKVDSGNLEYAAQKLNVSISEAQVIAAKVRNDPELGFNYFNNEQVKKKMGYGSSISISQTFTFGKRSAAIGLAKSETELSKSLLADYLRNLHADATISFFESLRQKKLYEIKKEAYQNISDLAKSDSIRFAKGKIMEIDAIQSKVEAGLTYNELLQAETEKNKSFTELSLYTGTTKSTLLYQPESVIKLTYRPYRLADLIEQGKTQRTDLVAAMQNIDVANKALKVAQREKNSDVTVSLQLQHNAEVKNDIAPAPSYNSLTAGISLPIPFSKMNRGSINAAKQRVRQASLEYDQAALQVQNEIMKAYYDYESAAKQVLHFENGLLRQAHEVLKGKIYSYNRGDTSLLEVLNAQRTYNEVQGQYYEAVFDYDSALINLEKSAGIWDIN